MKKIQISLKMDTEGGGDGETVDVAYLFKCMQELIEAKRSYMMKKQIYDDALAKFKGDIDLGELFGTVGGAGPSTPSTPKKRRSLVHERTCSSTTNKGLPCRCGVFSACAKDDAFCYKHCRETHGTECMADEDEERAERHPTPATPHGPLSPVPRKRRPSTH